MIEATIRQFMPLVRAKASSFSRSLQGYADYEDLVTIGMMAVWHAAKTYDPEAGASLGTHVYRQVQWAMLKERSRANTGFRGLRIPKLSIHAQTDDDLGIDLPDDSPLASERIETSEAVSALASAVHALTPQQRAVIVRRYFDGESYTEIATALGVTKQAAEQSDNAALDRMRPRLAFLRPLGLEKIAIERQRAKQIVAARQRGYAKRDREEES